MTISPKLSFGTAPAVVAAFAVALTTLPPMPAPAETSPQSDPGVARVSAIAGGVAVRRGDSKDAFAAAKNAPVNVGDYLTTENAGRAEVEFNNASLVRLSSGTQVRFVKLDSNAHELQLAEGTVELRVLHGLEAHPVVDTPVASIIPDQEGRYRVTVTHDGNTEVTVRSGKAEVQYGDGGQRFVTPGSTLLLTGSGNNPHLSSIITVAYDDFDKWADSQDQRWQHVTNWAYTDHGMVGANDLNQYGTWSDSADYGQVWQPNDEPAGWSPYSNGRWVWEPYYGWTWVGDEPWGYAPYHYGRWFFANGAWCWYPGTYGDGDPYAYAPALVGFFGWGDGGIDLDFANLGWTPLAPYEDYRPWWGNGGGTTIINNYYGGSGGYGGYGGYGNGRGNGYGNNGGNSYRNMNAPGGANGVSTGSFASGNFEHIQPVGAGLLKGIKPVSGTIPVVPTTGNLGSNGTRPAPINGITPISQRFSELSPLKSVIPSFDSQRTSVASAIKSQLPGITNIAGLGERAEGLGTSSTSTENTRGANDDVKAVGNERGFTTDRTQSEDRTTSDGAGNSTAWERFNTARGSDTSRFGASPQSERADTSAPETGRSGERVDGAANGNDAWSRFGATSPDRAASDRGESDRGNSDAGNRDANIPSYAMHSYDGGSRSGSDFARSASEGDRSTSEGDRSFSQPMHSFSDTGRSYSEPSHSYAEPARGYPEPSRSYSAPSRSYSAPSRSYSAPSRSYSAPSHYSAPRGNSGGGHEHSSGGGDHSKRK